MTYTFNAADLVQYHAVLDCYRKHIAKKPEFEALPDQFKTEDVDLGYLGTSWLFSSKSKRVLYQYSPNSFYMHYWKLPPATMTPIRNALNSICAYQLSRHRRRFGSGHLSDITNLVCEHLKSWLARLAERSLASPNDVKLEIINYVGFVKSLEKNNIFPPGSVSIKHEITMNSTLLEVSTSLEEAVQEVARIAQRRSLRDVVSQATRHIESVVDHSLQYLFYIFRDSKSPAAINMQRITWIELCRYKNIRETRSFRLLDVLLQSPYVKEVNRQNNPVFDENSVFVNHLENFNVKKSGKVGDVEIKSDISRQRSFLNNSIGGNLIPDRNFIRRWWSNIHSGIEWYFRKDEQLLENFVRLHGLIERLSFFSTICRQMEDIIDFFGMIIWVDFGRKVLDYFQEAFKRLHHEYIECCHQIHTTAKFRYNTLIQDGARCTVWCANFNHADRIYDTLSTDLECALQNMNSIPKAVDRFSPRRRDRGSEERLLTFVNRLNGFGLLFQMEPITCGEQVASINGDVQAIEFDSASVVGLSVSV